MLFMPKVKPSRIRRKKWYIADIYPRIPLLLFNEFDTEEEAQQAYQQFLSFNSEYVVVKGITARKHKLKFYDNSGNRMQVGKRLNYIKVTKYNYDRMPKGISKNTYRTRLRKLLNKKSHENTRLQSTLHP